MAATDLAICNMALSRLGANLASSITSPTTKEETQCQAIFDNERDAVLEAHRWGFAEKIATLADSGDTPVGWTYAYTMPSDCLAPRLIYNPNETGEESIYTHDHDRAVRSGKIEFVERIKSDLATRQIWCNLLAAKLIYTATVTDPNLFNAMFTDALADKLASGLAIPLKGSAQLRDTFYQSYLLKIDHSTNAFMGSR